MLSGVLFEFSFILSANIVLKYSLILFLSLAKNIIINPANKTPTTDIIILPLLEKIFPELKTNFKHFNIKKLELRRVSRKLSLKSSFSLFSDTTETLCILQSHWTVFKVLL